MGGVCIPPVFRVSVWMLGCVHMTLVVGSVIWGGTCLSIRVGWVEMVRGVGEGAEEVKGGSWGRLGGQKGGVERVT
jgi:hypothetical protein